MPGFEFFPIRMASFLATTTSAAGPPSATASVYACYTVEVYVEHCSWLASAHYPAVQPAISVAFLDFTPIVIAPPSTTIHERLQDTTLIDEYGEVNLEINSGKTCMFQMEAGTFYLYFYPSVSLFGCIFPFPSL